MSLFSKGKILDGQNAELSASLARINKPAEPETITEEALLSSMSEDDLLSAVANKAATDGRSMAASIVLEWAQNETNSFDDLESLVAGTIVDVDADEEDAEIDPDDLNEEDAKDFNNLFGLVGQALSQFSAMPAKTIQKFVDEESDDLAADVIAAIKEKTKGESVDELIADFAIREEMMLSAKVKVVRDGKVQYVTKKVRKRKMTAKQRAALKKAQKKSNNAAARAKRKKSMRLRKRNNM